MSHEKKNEIPPIIITKPESEKNSSSFDELINNGEFKDNMTERKMSSDQNIPNENGGQKSKTFLEQNSSNEKNQITEKTFVDFLKPPRDEKLNYIEVDGEENEKKDLTFEIEETKNELTNYEQNLTDKLTFYFNTEDNEKKKTNVTDSDPKFQERESIEENWNRKELLKSITKRNIQRKNVEKFLEKKLLENQKIQEESRKKEESNNSFLGNAKLKKLTLFLVFHVAGIYWQTLMSFFSCAVYVVGTYYPSDEYDQTPFKTLELIFVTHFTFDYIVGYIYAKNKIKFIFHYLSLIDLLTIVPVFAMLAAPTTETGSKADNISKLLNVVKVFRVFRILRLYRIFKLNRNNSSNTSEVSDIRKKIITIGSSILMLIFIAAGVIQSFQEMNLFGFSLNFTGSVLTFDLALYYMVVTCTTVGYGDISPSPDSSFAKSLIGLFIMLMIVIISKETSELTTLLQYDVQYRAGYKGSNSHILLIGNITANNLTKFLEELYHPDHETDEIVKVLIIQDFPPIKEIKYILENSKYEELLGYMIGNIFKEGTLKLAKAENSKVFIMNDQFVTDSKKDDTFALLASKAFREFGSNLKIYVQLYDPDYLLHSWADWNVAMSTQSFKMGIIAANVFYRGFGTLISNLIVSSSSGHIKEKSSLPLWTLEYMQGLGQEIYIIQFKNDEDGLYKNQLFSRIARERGVLLIGIRHLNVTEGDDVTFYETIINPHDYVLQEDDEGILLATNPDEAKSVFFSEEIESPLFEKIPFNSTINELLEDIRIEQTKIESEGELSKDYYRMWEVDMQDVLRNHIIVFGLYEHFSGLVGYLANYTNQYICYISDKPPNETWPKLRREFPKVRYFECTLTNLEELRRTGIDEAYHVILLTWLVNDSSIQDSGILPIARIMEENFKNVPFTLELIDETNMKYLNNRPNKVLEKTPPLYWPRFASSNVFFSSTMDYLMAQAFHNEAIVDIVGKLILGQKFNPNISKIEENSNIMSIKIPDSLPEFVSYSHIFQYLVSRPISILPIGIFRFSGSYDNSLPFILTNPKPNSPIMNGDIILVLGPEETTEVVIKEAASATLERLKSNLTNFAADPRNESASALEEMIEIANRIIKEDDQLDIDNSEIATLVENEINLTTADRKNILEENEKLKNALSEYYFLKEQFFAKKNTYYTISEE